MGSPGSSNLATASRIGISEPISTGGPSEFDVIKTHELEKLLVDVGLYESHEEAIKREEVLGRLDQIVKTWVKNITRAKGYNESIVHEANAKIFTFGSYRLGEDFFGELHKMLAEMPEVQELHPVPEAHVPVMRFKFDGVSIDLLYANVSLWVIPEDLDISQESILQNVDDQTVRSLNGCRVTDQILRLVPNIQAIEANKASWGTLFEPFAFFEAYKNYLQIDIEAETDDDLMNWKGWVESRKRLLTLKCHPHPGEFSDKSKPFHHSYFMGLRRKQGANPQEGEQFDIRMTVEDFKRDVYAYSFWKPTMWIQVCHVKRKDLPNFVFPGGVRPSPPARTSAESRSVSKSSSLQADAVMSRKKRKQDDVNKGFSLTESSGTGMCISDATSLDETMAKKQFEPDFSGTTSNGPEIAGFGQSKPGSSFALDKPVIEQSYAQTINHQGSSEALNGLLEDVQLKSEAQHSGETEGIKPSSPFSSEQAVSNTMVQQKGDLEELEPLELSVASATASASTNMPAQKPLIRYLSAPVDRVE
ncbi:hypothetical protein DH2020_043927 [Rehmannia glutinosa]|uniref:Polynucleotide adenylyltransferase n=1 Tax=Rehmannia glutinosa TaxID=99300 RepID=A0ABR0UJ27_REHGL